MFVQLFLVDASTDAVGSLTLYQLSSEELESFLLYLWCCRPLRPFLVFLKVVLLRKRPQGRKGGCACLPIRMTNHACFPERDHVLVAQGTYLAGTVAEVAGMFAANSFPDIEPVILPSTIVITMSAIWPMR